MPRIEAASATHDVTPGESVPMPGYGPVERRSTGVHDPIYVTSLVVSDGETAVGVTAVDALDAGGLADPVRRRIRDGGAPLDDVVVAASHTHSGPFVPNDVDARLPFHPPELGYASADPAVASTAESIEDAMVETLQEAADALEPATLRVGTAENHEISINRRSAGGTMGMIDLTGARPNPSADVDPEVAVVDVEGRSGDRTVLYNFPMHTTCMGGSELSADWPGVTRELVSRALDGATVMFLNGAAGDVVPRDSFDSDERYDSREEFTWAIGAGVAETVLEAIESGGRSTTLAGSVRAERRTVDLPLRSVDDREALERRRRELTAEIDRDGIEVDNPLTQNDVTRRRFLVDLRLALDELDAEAVSTTAQYVELGGLGLVAPPGGQPFVEHGLDFKSHADVETLLVAGFANEFLTYLPTLEGIQRGGYEVERAHVGAEAVKVMREVTFDLLE